MNFDGGTDSAEGVEKDHGEGFRDSGPGVGDVIEMTQDSQSAVPSELAKLVV